MYQDIAADESMERNIELEFRQLVRDEGVKLDSVSIDWYDDSNGTKIILNTSKEINGEKRQTRINLGPVDPTSNTLGLELDAAARDLAVAMEDAMTKTISVGDSEILFCADDGGWAKCRACGEGVTLSQVVRSTPQVLSDDGVSDHQVMNQPMPYEVQHFLRKLDDDGRWILQYYLLGALRGYCQCDFGWVGSESFKY